MFAMILFSSSDIFNLSFGLNFFVYLFFIQSQVRNHRFMVSTYSFTKADCHLVLHLSMIHLSLPVSSFSFSIMDVYFLMNLNLEKIVFIFL